MAEEFEEKVKMWKVNGRRTTDAKWWQKLTLSLARWAKKKHYIIKTRRMLILYLL